MYTAPSVTYYCHEENTKVNFVKLVDNPCGIQQMSLIARSHNHLTYIVSYFRWTRSIYSDIRIAWVWSHSRLVSRRLVEEKHKEHRMANDLERF